MAPRQSARNRRRLRGPWWAWLSMVLGTVLVVGASGALVGISLVVNRYGGAVATDDLLGDTRNGDGLRGPLNILLVGSDYRKSPKLKGSLWRADTVMVLHVPRTHDKAYLLSFSRDLKVDIPPAESGRWSGGEDKLNAAFAHGGNGTGGYRLLAETLSELIGIDFDSGAVINFYGFINVVQVLGGVKLCVETPGGTDRFTSIHPPYRTFHKGCRHYDGYAALDYIRQRKQFSDGDHARMRHQQQFLKALLVQARKQGVHRDIGKLDKLIRAAGSSLTIDDNIPVAELGFTLRDIRPENLSAIEVPSEGHPGKIWYAELVDPADSLFEAVRNDTVESWVKEHPKYVNSLG